MAGTAAEALYGINEKVDDLNMVDGEFISIILKALIRPVAMFPVIFLDEDTQNNENPNQNSAPEVPPPMVFRIFLTKNMQDGPPPQERPNFVHSNDPNDPYIFRE